MNCGDLHLKKCTFCGKKGLIFIGNNYDNTESLYVFQNWNEGGAPLNINLKKFNFKFSLWIAYTNTINNVEEFLKEEQILLTDSVKNKIYELW